MHDTVTDRYLENEFAAEESRRLGMNPIKRVTRTLKSGKKVTYIYRYTKEGKPLYRIYKRRNPNETKPMAKSLLPALLIGTAIVVAISYAGRRATEE